MKIIFLANIRLPTSRAHGYAIMKMCSEFSRQGTEVKLVVPDRSDNEGLSSDPFVFYGLSSNFVIDKIWNPDLLGRTTSLNPLFYWVDLLSFVAGVILKRKISKKDVIYTRDYLLLLFLGKNKKGTLELHDIPKSKLLFKLALKKTRLIFVLNENIKNVLINLGVAVTKIHISPSAVDLEKFDIMMDQASARKEVGLPLDKKIVMYTGHLYEWKGITNLLEVAKLEPEILFVFLGGVEPEFSKLRFENKDDKNILLLPFAERKVVPIYLKAADVLVIPNSRKEEISAKFTSPLKLFEYMAAKRPIVASDLPSIRQILNEESAVFAEADSTESLRRVIMKVLSDNKLAENVSTRAFALVKDFTWERRVEDIIKLLK